MVPASFSFRRAFATSSPKNLIFLWQVSRRERREEAAEEEEAAPWWTGVGGADRVEDVEAEEESWRTTRAGDRSIVVVVIVVVEDDLFGAPSSCPRTFSRTLGMHQILFGSHRTPGRETPSLSPDVRSFVFRISIGNETDLFEKSSVPYRIRWRRLFRSDSSLSDHSSGVRLA